MTTAVQSLGEDAAERVDTGRFGGRFGGWLDVVLGALVGAVMAGAIYDRSFFFGDGALVTGIYGDAGSSFAGFRAFIVDGWHFPLLETHLLTNGQGDPTVIAFTDSLPLLALTAKVFGFLGVSANAWIAVWYYGNVVAQGAAAGLVARVFGVSSRWTTAAMAVVAVTAPVMIMRVWHPGLYGHFVIVLAWAAAGNLWRRRSAEAAWWFIPVMILSLLVHPYFFAMNGVMVVGVICAAASLRWISVAETARWFVVMGVVLLAAMYLLGYLPSDAIPPGGYGAFAMPVVSPFWPQWSGLWPGDEGILLNRNLSFEGINYLGAGGVLAVVAALVLGWRRIVAFAVRQQVLVVFMVVLTVVAVSHKVYFWTREPFVPLGEELSAINNLERGPMTVLALLALVGFMAFVWSWRSEEGRVIRPATTTLAVMSVGAVLITVMDRRLIWDQLQQFRASGRFFWVVGYGLSMGAIVVLDRWFAARQDRWRQGPALLGVAMVVIAGAQVADTGRYRDFVPEMFGSTPERVEQIDLLATVVAAHDDVEITPDWFCTAMVNEALTEFQDTVIAATMTEVPINGYYGGRTDTDTTCPAAASAAGGSVLTVVVRPLSFPELIDVEPDVECRFSQHMALCSEHWDEIDPSVRDRFALVPLPWPPP